MFAYFFLHSATQAPILCMGLFCCCCCCCCLVASVVSDSVRPHRQQPTRLPRPWDSPGKNTGVGCHFLVQCMKVKSESEVAQSCPTLRDPMDCSLPASSIHGIFQARVLEWGAIAFSDRTVLGAVKGIIYYWPDPNPLLALRNARVCQVFDVSVNSSPTFPKVRRQNSSVLKKIF